MLISHDSASNGIENVNISAGIHANVTHTGYDSARENYQGWWTCR